MQRNLLLICVLSLLAGCVYVQPGDSPVASASGNIPEKTIKNEKCENIPAVKIFQVMDDFALAWTCDSEEDTDGLHCLGYTVYVPKEKGQLYFDDKVVTPGKGKCISFNSVYSYEDIFEGRRTIPVIKMINAEVPNPAYKKWQDEQKKNEEKKK